MVLAFAFGSGPVSAHRQVKESPEDPEAKSVDIESVVVTHPPSTAAGEELLTNHVRFTVTFRDPHPLADKGSLRVNLRTARQHPKGPPQRYITLKRNPDGSVVGVMRNWAGGTRSYANIYFPDDRSAVVEFHRQQLRFPRQARFIDWTVFASYHDEDCQTGDIVGVCTDVMIGPDGGYFRHRL